MDEINQDRSGQHQRNSHTESDDTILKRSRAKYGHAGFSTGYGFESLFLRQGPDLPFHAGFGPGVFGEDEIGRCAKDADDQGGNADPKSGALSRRVHAFDAA
jgi:hypothetical protein